MDVIIRDHNGNTLSRLEDVIEGEPVGVHFSMSDAGNLFLTLTLDERSEEEIDAESMKASDMRAMPEWGL